MFRDYLEVDGERQKVELTVEPQAGRALLFRHHRWHEGTPVVSGRKYVLRTNWLNYQKVSSGTDNRQEPLHASYGALPPNRTWMDSRAS